LRRGGGLRCRGGAALHDVGDGRGRAAIVARDACEGLAAAVPGHDRRPFARRNLSFLSPAPQKTPSAKECRASVPAKHVKIIPISCACASFRRSRGVNRLFLVKK